MATYSVNEAGVKKARELINENEYVLESHWAKAQPATQDENEFIEDHGWDAYGAWHLGLHDEQDNPETKDRYGFCFGDFHKLHRRALIGAIDRAAEWHHDEIEAAARDLLDYLDSQTDSDS